MHDWLARLCMCKLNVGALRLHSAASPGFHTRTVRLQPNAVRAQVLTTPADPDPRHLLPFQ
jgi:hypothetical protein